ncbi:MAG: WD40 repeat domain-containing protein [Candidatus Poribacteria bacterium]|nr:WD40 repeat domain-containing protein [Candidatus Poribacteria bacterium]
MSNLRGAKRLLHFLCVCLFTCGALEALSSPLISPLGLPDGAKMRIGRGTVHSVDYSPDGKRIAAASTIGVWIYDALYGREIALLRGHTGWVNTAEYSPDGKRIVSAGLDHTVRIWDAETGEPLKTLTGHTDRVASAAYSPDGKRIVSASWDRTIRIWNAEKGELLHTLEGHTSWVISAAYSPDGKRIVSGSADRTVRIWDAETGEPLKTLKEHTRRVVWAGYSPDGTIIASGGYDDTIRIWDAQTGEPIRTLSKRYGDVVSVAFSPDGKHIASGETSNLMLWNAAYGAPLRPFEGGEGADSIAFSPDGHFIAGGVSNNMPRAGLTGEMGDAGIRIWNIKFRALVRTFDGHTHGPRYVAFAPDGNWFAVEFYGEPLQIRRADTGALLKGSRVAKAAGRSHWKIYSRTERKSPCSRGWTKRY